MFSNNKLQQIVTELIIRGRRVNIPLVYITESCFVVPRTFKRNSMHYFFNETNKQEFQQFTMNHSPSINKSFMNLCEKKCYKTMFFFTA